MQHPPLHHSVSLALAEDLGSGDITAELLPNHQSIAQIICREPAVLCGQAWVEETFHQLDKHIQIEWFYKEGEEVPAGAQVCTITGPARALVTGERTALNFLQTLSGTATTTRAWVKRLEGTGCQLLDTRKTLPGLRLAQKYAVRVGGGTNHRLGLYDAYLIKENHIAAAGGVTPALLRARELHPEVFLEVEVETLDQFKEAVAARPDRIMLDNFPLEVIKQALALPHEGIPLEVSGGIDPTLASTLAQMGVDFISIGAVTKHVQAIDFSMIISE